MGRPSNREEKRAEILRAFALVLADHGYAGATVAKVATEAGISAGLVHHHFESKDELLGALLDLLIAGFRERLRQQSGENALQTYADAALQLDEKADTVAARCWVGLFAEAVRNPELFRKVRRMLDSEIGALRGLSGHRLSDHQASAILAFVMGSLVFGAFAPRKTAGFAAPALKDLIQSFSA